jgi:hypothetical protein
MIDDDWRNNRVDEASARAGCVALGVDVEVVVEAPFGLTSVVDIGDSAAVAVGVLVGSGVLAAMEVSVALAVAVVVAASAGAVALAEACAHEPHLLWQERASMRAQQEV